MGAAKVVSEKRCGTVAVLTRADDLAVGDVLLLNRWDGGVKLAEVASTELCGDDVVVTFLGASNGELTTSVGNTFHVVGENR
jgi:hypothetical protein